MNEPIGNDINGRPLRVGDEVADAYDEGYNEAASKCMSCGIEFNRGVKFGITLARMKLLEFTGLSSEDAIAVDNFLNSLAKTQD